jgi:hypothetical protein
MRPSEVPMRPAFRFALLAGIGAALLSTFGAWYAYRPVPHEAAPGSGAGAAGITAAPLERPVVGTPTPAELTQALDRVEAAEAERFGADEAAHRRRQRERVLQQRLQGEAGDP